MSSNLRSLGRSLSMSAWLLRHPLYSRPGHFYSPITSEDDVTRALSQRPRMAALDGVDLNADHQRELASELAPSWPTCPSLWKRYQPANAMFGSADATVYQSMITELRPRRIVEVGSGYSSALALDIRDAVLPDLELVFIEPYPDRLLGLTVGSDQRRVTLHKQPVQSVPLTVFDTLESGDVLFIDSTHVAKAGSDVNWLLFCVLPRLAPGVLIHVHDIFFPFDYADAWLAQGRSWNESYMMRAFLSYNQAFEIMLFNSWLWEDQAELIREYLPTAADQRPGSLWIRKTELAAPVS